MIQETLSTFNKPVLTSDHWHVVHARWAKDRSGEPLFARSIVSEHEDRGSATSAARELLASMAAEMAARPLARRDQVLVRKPAYKSLKSARRVQRRPR